MIKQLNQALEPVRIVIEQTGPKKAHATFRMHGAPEKVKPILADILKALQAGDLRVDPGVYRIEVTRKRLHLDYNLRPVN